MVEDVVGWEARSRESFELMSGLGIIFRRRRLAMCDVTLFTLTLSQHVHNLKLSQVTTLLYLRFSQSMHRR